MAGSRTPTAPAARSAGVVVVRRDSGWRLLILRAYRNWDFPKGRVEPDEAPLDAAIRETAEEAAISDLAFNWGKAYCETAPYRGEGGALLPGGNRAGDHHAAGFAGTRAAGAPRMALGELRRGRASAAAAAAAGAGLGPHAARHVVLAARSAGYRAHSAARARNSPAPSPCHALPCMQASVAGAAEARGSSICPACFVWEK
jgi:hypothetical protein